jgi:hypothetical protein
LHSWKGSFSKKASAFPFIWKLREYRIDHAKRSMEIFDTETKKMIGEIIDLEQTRIDLGNKNNVLEAGYKDSPTAMPLNIFDIKNTRLL